MSSYSIKIFILRKLRHSAGWLKRQKNLIELFIMLGTLGAAIAAMQSAGISKQSLELSIAKDVPRLSKGNITLGAPPTSTELVVAVPFENTGGRPAYDISYKSYFFNRLTNCAELVYESEKTGFELYPFETTNILFAVKNTEALQEFYTKNVPIDIKFSISYFDQTNNSTRASTTRDFYFNTRIQPPATQTGKRIDFMGLAENSFSEFDGNCPQGLQKP